MGRGELRHSEECRMFAQTTLACVRRVEWNIQLLLRA